MQAVPSRDPGLTPAPASSATTCCGGVLLPLPSSQVISTVTFGWASSCGTTVASQLSPMLIKLVPEFEPKYAGQAAAFPGSVCMSSHWFGTT